MDAPGSHLTYDGRCKRAWVSPAAWCTVPRGLSGPRLATGRPGSSPSPWHGKVDVSARACQYTCWDGFACVPLDPEDTARPFVGVWGPLRPRTPPSTTPGRPILARFPPNSPLPSEGFWCVAMERGGLARDGGLLWMPKDPT